jgi:hypothetical protein
MKLSKKLLYRFFSNLNESQNKSSFLSDESEIDNLINNIIEKISLKLLNHNINFLDIEKKRNQETKTIKYIALFELNDTIDLQLVISVKTSYPEYFNINSRLIHKSPVDFNEDFFLLQNSNLNSIFINSFDNLKENLFEKCLESIKNNIDIFSKLYENKNLDIEFEATYKKALIENNIFPISIKKLTSNLNLNPNLIAKYSISLLFDKKEKINLIFVLNKFTVSVFYDEPIAREMLNNHNFNMYQTLQSLSSKLYTWFENFILQNEENYNTYDDDF